MGLGGKVSESQDSLAESFLRIGIERFERRPPGHPLASLRAIEPQPNPYLIRNGEFIGAVPVVQKIKNYRGNLEGRGKPDLRALEPRMVQGNGSRVFYFKNIILKGEFYESITGNSCR
jgi:hypothetical protein